MSHAVFDENVLREFWAAVDVLPEFMSLEQPDRLSRYESLHVLTKAMHSAAGLLLATEARKTAFLTRYDEGELLGLQQRLRDCILKVRENLPRLLHQEA